MSASLPTRSIEVDAFAPSFAASARAVERARRHLHAGFMRRMRGVAIRLAGGRIAPASGDERPRLR
jgi:hypothetical protein